MSISRARITRIEREVARRMPTPQKSPKFKKVVYNGKVCKTFRMLIDEILKEEVDIERIFESASIYLPASVKMPKSRH